MHLIDTAVNEAFRKIQGWFESQNENSLNNIKVEVRNQIIRNKEVVKYLLTNMGGP